MKKIIAFSLWGDNPKYCIGAIKNAELLEKIYPDWIGRFYCGQSVPNDIINKLREIQRCEVVIMNEPGDWRGTFWRFYPAGEIDVDVMISRDCDSRLNLREKTAVDQWLKSNKSFHIMRDHPFHDIEILAGMWGVRGNMLYDMKELINDYPKGNFWQVEQKFLKEFIYNRIFEDCFVHDEFFSYNTNAYRFPTMRQYQQFVGEPFDENDNPNLQLRSMLS